VSFQFGGLRVGESDCNRGRRIEGESTVGAILAVWHQGKIDRQHFFRLTASRLFPVLVDCEYPWCSTASSQGKGSSSHQPWTLFIALCLRFPSAGNSDETDLDGSPKRRTQIQCVASTSPEESCCVILVRIVEFGAKIVIPIRGTDRNISTGALD
jgi:hypothetical protein